jgi:hypothetical protein
MTDHPVSMDRLIDDVARSMHSGDAPALRVAVVARLGRQRRAATWLIGPGAALAGAAALAIALAIHRTPASAPTPPPATTAARAAVTAPVAATAEYHSAPAPRTHKASVAASADPEPEGPSIAALPAIDAVPVSEIQPKPLGVPQLNVERVANVTPLSVAALDEIDRDR